MNEQIVISHHIQKYIIGVLLYQRYARFRDMRPPKTDTNLYSYHLSSLQKIDMITKTPEGYTLSRRGLIYVDKLTNQKLNIRTQPKIITMLVVQNTDGDVLLLKRGKQPFMDKWTLPYGKLHIDDVSVRAAAQREAREKIGVDELPAQHAGDCYVRIMDEGECIISTLAHIFYATCDTVTEIDAPLMWVRPHRLYEYDLAPAVEHIVTRTFFKDPYFFEEYEDSLT